MVSHFLMFFILDPILPEPKRLPTVVVNSELNFFSSNAAICYFLPPPENLSSDIYEWLQWEATKLSPALSLLGGSVKNESIKNNIPNLLKFVDKGIKSDYLAGVSKEL